MKINVLRSSLVSSVALSLWAASAANAGVIAWSTNTDVFYGDHSIYLMNEDGSNKRQLVSPQAIPNVGSGDNRMPAVSPDGTKVAFSRWVDNTYRYDLFVINIDGTGLRRVTESQYFDLYPSWSPDGSKLAFVSSGNASGQNILTINADGTGQVVLQTQAADLEGLAWSPDGSKILFTAVSGTPSGMNKSIIYAINANGTGLTALVDDSFYNANPSWSPNGQSIVFNSNRNANTTYVPDLYKMNADGSGITALTTTGDNFDPVFDGQGNVIFTSSRDGNYEIYSLSAAGNAFTRLTNTVGDLSGGCEDIDPAWGGGATTPLNHAPVATNDYYAFKIKNPQKSLSVSAPGVLGNDSDVDSATVTTLVPTLVSGPKYGTLTFNANGSFSYKPSPTFLLKKVDTFTYSINDGQLTSNVATVTIARKN